MTVQAKTYKRRQIHTRVPQPTSSTGKLEDNDEATMFFYCWKVTKNLNFSFDLLNLYK